MAYREDFYTRENITGYTGVLYDPNKLPTIYFKTETEYGRITGFHPSKKHIGRALVRLQYKHSYKKMSFRDHLLYKLKKDPNPVKDYLQIKGYKSKKFNSIDEFVEFAKTLKEYEYDDKKMQEFLNVTYSDKKYIHAEFKGNILIHKSRNIFNPIENLNDQEVDILLKIIEKIPKIKKTDQKILNEEEEVSSVGALAEIEPENVPEIRKTNQNELLKNKLQKSVPEFEGYNEETSSVDAVAEPENKKTNQNELLKNKPQKSVSEFEGYNEETSPVDAVAEPEKNFEIKKPKNPVARYLLGHARRMKEKRNNRNKRRKGRKR